MAADLIMPTVPGDQQQSRHFLSSNRPSHHVRSHSYQIASGPQISPVQTSDFNQNQISSTPPSPRGMSGRGATRPLYMPAVLRPNYEFPPQPLSKSPGSTSESGSDTTLRRSNTGLLSLQGLGAIGTRLTRRATTESTKSIEGQWNLELYPEVASPPSRKHWKPDTESSICDDPTCKRTFNYFTRRHHCRKCGNIFCDTHSNAALPLDQDANFNPRAVPSRTCNHCFEQFKSWHSRHNSQSSGSSNSNQPPTPSHPIATNNPAAGGFDLPTHKDVAASVPRDWNWSTF